MRLRNIIKTSVKLQLYKGSEFNFITYDIHVQCICNLVWHFCKTSDPRKLERV